MLVFRTANRRVEPEARAAAWPAAEGGGVQLVDVGVNESAWDGFELTAQRQRGDLRLYWAGTGSRAGSVWCSVNVWSSQASCAAGSTVRKHHTECSTSSHNAAAATLLNDDDDDDDDDDDGDGDGDHGDHGGDGDVAE
eukprot:COSAG05_NODE_1878_length_3911_cov_62.469576_3_plen_138_part_00